MPRPGVAEAFLVRAARGLGGRGCRGAEGSVDRKCEHLHFEDFGDCLAW